MTYRISLILSVLLTAATIQGCSGSESRQQSSIQQTAAPLSPAADNSEWIKRLLATPPDATVTQVAASSTPPVVLPIPTEQGNSVSGNRYSLVVDQTARIVWLQQHNGLGTGMPDRNGPWSMSQPDVEKLLRAAEAAQTR
ncbi:MAG TPA: hypothetical protein EYG03_00625 [Planctomycetes bacterium]|nr:hypothetical protein [Fuerstiella sp.]HIK90484.1 hypothetical protein [Planctomycetota bacterium]